MLPDSFAYTLRNGLLPLLDERALLGLHTAILTRDPKLIHGGTTKPLPIELVLDWECEGGCLVAYPGFGEGLVTVKEIETYFCQMVHAMDLRMGEPGCLQYLTGPWDSPDAGERSLARAAVVDEIRAELARRKGAAA